jgi:hypothetical protein
LRLDHRSPGDQEALVSANPESPPDLLSSCSRTLATAARSRPAKWLEAHSSEWRLLSFCPERLHRWNQPRRMPLTAGAHLGACEILAAIGAGGMGEVYRARDTKLNRDVALKVLPEAFTADPDRLARFQREAQVLASFNHPNIAHVHGIEDAGPTSALVMELVDGPTLAEMIQTRRGLPLDEVLAIAWQIAEALETAHELGIVHRDLKPANVKVRDVALRVNHRSRSDTSPRPSTTGTGCSRRMDTGSRASRTSPAGRTSTCRAFRSRIRKCRFPRRRHRPGLEQERRGTLLSRG